MSTNWIADDRMWRVAKSMETVISISAIHYTYKIITATNPIFKFNTGIRCIINDNPYIFNLSLKPILLFSGAKRGEKNWCVSNSCCDFHWEKLKIKSVSYWGNSSEKSNGKIEPNLQQECKTIDTTWNIYWFSMCPSKYGWLKRNTYL